MDRASGHNLSEIPNCEFDRRDKRKAQVLCMSSNFGEIW